MNLRIWAEETIAALLMSLSPGHACVCERAHATYSRSVVFSSARVGECINSAASFIPVETAAPSLSQVAPASGSALRPVTAQLTAAVIDSPAQRGSVITTGGVIGARDKD